jgi:hypothetical protein
MTASGRMESVKVDAVCTYFCLEGLRKPRKISFRTAGARDDTGTGGQRETYNPQKSRPPRRTTSVNTETILP